MIRRVILAASLVWLSVSASVLAAPPSSAPADPRWHDLPDTNTVFKPAEYKALDEWKARREWLREQVRVAAGLWPEPERTPLNATIRDPRVYAGYTIEKVHFESYPGFYVTGNLYRPTKRGGKIPAVACPHGHWPHGRLHQDDTGDIPARCITLARLGATVFAYDMIGYNDSKRQIDHRINTPERDLWGITSLHLQTWNSIRVLDFLQSLPEVDPERIGVTGASGGGTQTFILYAIDDRVKVAAPVNMISSTMQGGCICENAPCLRIDTNNMEIGALMAPRPLLMISATGDWTKLTPQAEYPFIRSVYELYSAADKVKNVHIDAPHNYNKGSREAMYRFFARWLLKRDDADTITEGQIPKFKPEELLVWTDETAPKNLLTIEQLTREIKSASQTRSSAIKTIGDHDWDEWARTVQLGLRHSLGSSFPAGMEVQWGAMGGYERKTKFYSRRSRPGSSVYGHSAIVAHGSRQNASAYTHLILQVLPARESDPRRFESLFTGDSIPPAVLESIVPFPAEMPTNDAARPRDSTSFFTTFNRTDTAEAAFDVLTVLGWELAHINGQTASLTGVGRMGPVTLVARAMVPASVARVSKLRTVIDMNRFDIDSDEAYLKQLNIPHIRRIGGLRAIAAVACNGPIWFHNVGDKFDEEWVKAAGKTNGVEVRVTREKADEKAIAEWLTK